MGKKSKKAEVEKTELGNNLFSVKKKLNTESVDKWTAWAKEKRPDLFVRANAPVWYRIMVGSYISKDNVPFACEALLEGVRLRDAQEEAIKQILNTTENGV